MAKNPGIEVNVIQIPASTDEKLAYYLQQIHSKSSEIDIFSVDIAWIGDSQESLLDLNKLGLKEIAGKMFPISGKCRNVKRKTGCTSMVFRYCNILLQK